MEITTNEIKYKKFDNLEGPTISILKSEVFMIKYQNGTKDVINPAAQASTTTPNTETAKKKKYVDNKPNRFGIYAQPLGFVQFGPIVGMELTLASHLIIDAHVRFSSLGLLMYVVSKNDNDGAPYKISGAGIGGSIKCLIPSKIGGFYFGLLLEDGWHTEYYAEGKPWIWQEDVQYFVTAPNIGYKFRFPGGFYLNTGAIFGAAFVTSQQWHYTKNYNNDSSIHDDGSKVQPFGMLELGFGVEF
jgi:hypothetical protein